MTKLLTIAALALSLTSGIAFAQEGGGEATGSDADTGNSSTSDTTGAQGGMMLGNREMMGSFYTDDTMTTMRTGDEFTAAFNAMSAEDRAAMTAECASDNGQNRAFCDAFTAAGAN